MNHAVLIVFLLFFSMLSAQDAIEGTWKTIDDISGKPRSIVNIYKKNGKWYGRIKRVLDENERGQLCVECKGNDYNKPIEGLEIIKNLKKDEDEYTNGTIMDPENGKVYKCKIWIDDTDSNILNVRGYIAFFYRTQCWVRE
ncbi:DUF2147 domain-containing protein [Aquimarina sp. 2201CG1-2-11]|uniref:DUF2147 domain-containing protein n=1 Tax=Aquimarina discodermiae TaxID=3231043 RepID=UPI003462E4C3